MPSDASVRVSWRTEPPSPAQRRAWIALWNKLLGDAGPASKKEEPQAGEPEADATVSSGHNLSELSNDNTIVFDSRQNL